MKKNNVFWIGYSDLMTSLFFVMLVLFVTSLGYLKVRMEQSQDGELLLTTIDSLSNEIKNLKITIEQQDKLLRIEDQFKPLETSGYFVYLPECKKYISKDLMGNEIFRSNSSSIKSSYKSKTIDVGVQIQDFLRTLYRKDKNLSYLLVIEGNMANTYDQKFAKDNTYGYKKSYERALAVYDLWTENNINLRKYNTEVMLCGSGFNGLCRDENEDNNKRFSIQIIPKVQNQN